VKEALQLAFSIGEGAESFVFTTALGFFKARAFHVESVTAIMLLGH